MLKLHLTVVRLLGAVTAGLATTMLAAPSALAANGDIACNNKLADALAPTVNDLGGSIVGLKKFVPLLIIILVVLLIFLVKTRHGSGLVSHLLSALGWLVVLGFIGGIVTILMAAGPNC